MKSCVLLLALLQSLGCSGIPVNYSELQSMTDRVLGVALAQINSGDTVKHLYRVTQGYIKKVFPMGHDTADLLLMFEVKETECAKTSRIDPQTCAFRPGFFVPSFSCSSRLRMTATTVHVISVGCGHDSSSIEESSKESSEESSEEIFSKGQRQFNNPFANRGPAPAGTPPPVQHGGLFRSQPVEVRPRGDTFSNFLE